MSTFPSALSALTDPQPTDRLNAPSHSSIESAQNDGIEKVEAFIGTLSSVQGTLMYDIRAAASDGGGHVQGVTKGGTNQTTYTKGDILVAANSSTLSKLAVGSDGQIIKANSSTASGVNWTDDTTPRILVSASAISVTNTTTETSIMGAVIPASILGATNALRSMVFVDNWTSNNSDMATTFKGHFGTASVALTVGSISGVSQLRGNVSFTVLANNSTTSQRAILVADLAGFGYTGSVYGGVLSSSSLIGINSSANQTMGMTAKWNATSVDNDLDTVGYIIEKIT